MKIVIRQNAYTTGTNWEYRKAIEAVSGQTLEVETKHLFSDQFNTTNGLRVMESQVVEIIDDARIGLGKCSYCYAQAPIGTICHDKKVSPLIKKKRR